MKKEENMVLKEPTDDELKKIKTEKQSLEVADSDFGMGNSVKYYLREIVKYPLLTKEEELLYANILSSAKDLSIVSIEDEGKMLLDLKKFLIYLSNSDNPELIIEKLNKFLITNQNLNNQEKLKVLKEYKRLYKKLNRVPNIEEVSSLLDFNKCEIKEEKINLEEEVDRYIEYSKIYDLFINSNLRLAFSIACKYREYHSIEDLINVANIGLIKALNGFNAKLGYKFSTYATWWIKASIVRYLYNNTNNGIKTPENFIREAKILKDKIKKVEEKYGRKLSLEELEKELKIDKNIIYRYLTVGNSMISLDQPITSDYDISYADILVGDNIDDLSINSFLPDDIEIIFENLNEKEKEIVKMRFGIGLEKNYTLDEIRKIKQITLAQARRIEKNAFRKMRYKVANDGKAASLKLYL